MSEKTIMKRLEEKVDFTLEDLEMWSNEQAAIMAEANAMMNAIQIVDAFGIQILNLDEIKSLFMKKVTTLVASKMDKTEVIRMALILAGLSATGNSTNCLKLMKRKELMTDIWKTMEVLPSGKYDKSNPFSFPLSFYGRIFPEMREKVGKTIVAPKFANVINYLETEVCRAWTKANLGPFLYPGGASAVPICPANGSLIYLALMTMISIIISRRKDGSGTWTTVTIDTTRNYLEITAQDGYGAKKAKFETDCPERPDMIKIVSAFCSEGSLYAAHPVYGPKKV